MVVFHVMIFSLDLSRSKYYYWPKGILPALMTIGCSQGRQTPKKANIPTCGLLFGNTNDWLLQLLVEKVFCNQANRFIKKGIRNCQSSVCNKRKHFNSTQSRRWAVIKKSQGSQENLEILYFSKYSHPGTHFEGHTFSIQGEQKLVEDV